MISDHGSPVFAFSYAAAGGSRTWNNPKNFRHSGQRPGIQWHPHNKRHCFNAEDVTPLASQASDAEETFNLGVSTVSIKAMFCLAGIQGTQ
jgi:hypothetical protein